MLQALVTHRKLTMSAAFVMLALLAGVPLYIKIFVPGKVPDLQEFGAEMLQQPIPMGAFELTDHKSQAFNLESLKGKWTFLYFGYMTCSDLCPTTMSAMNQVYDSLSKSKRGIDDLQFTFVSVDPHRDTLDKIKDYVTFFNPKFLGVTGSLEGLNKLTLHVGAKFAYEDVKTKKVVDDVNNLTDDTNYIVRHFGDLFVFDPEARLVAYIYPYHDKKKILAVYDKIRNYY